MGVARESRLELLLRQIADSQIEADANPIAAWIMAGPTYPYAYMYAIRHCAFTATTCEDCIAADGEEVSALLVFEDMADHNNGKCTFTFHSRSNA